MTQPHDTDVGLRRPQRLWRPVRLLVTIVFTFAIAPTVIFSQSQRSKSPSVTTDARGRKFVNKIPYDVFFDRPLELIAHQDPRGRATESKTERIESNNSSVPRNDRRTIPEQDEAVPTDVKSPTTFGNSSDPAEQSISGIRWHEFLPMEELQGEAKSIRNRLTSSLKTQGQFRQNFKSIAVDGYEIAALGMIAREHRESGSWKNNAAYVTEFGAQIGRSASGMSKSEFEATRMAFQKLVSVLDGSIPPDAGDLPSKPAFHEIASRKELMKRIERSRNWLQKDVNSESKLKSNSAGVQREAAILAALVSVVATPGFEYTENGDYRDFARQLVEAAREAADAGRDDSFSKFKLAVDKINKSCTDCHGVYGNG